MPRLRDILNPWFADVIYQRESQSVRVRPAVLINARAFAIFRDRSFPASLQYRDGIARERIGAPDLCLWLCSCNVKRSIGIDRPERAQRIGPLPCERGRTGARDRLASGNYFY